jgi:hypothetical protein
MSEITGKSGLNGAITLLFSVFILAGLNMTQAYGQPLDSPLYNHTNTKAVESMNAPAEANLAAGANGPAPADAPTFGLVCHTWPTCKCYLDVPVMSPPGEIVFILTLTGGACWAILKKKRP